MEWDSLDTYSKKKKIERNSMIIRTFFMYEDPIGIYLWIVLIEEIMNWIE